MKRPIHSLAGILILALLSACQSTPVQPMGTVPQAANRLAEVHTQLGIGYLREGKLDQAYNRLERALEADPNFSTAHNAMGLLQEQLKNPRKAEEHYRRAVSINPGDSAAQNNYGGFLCRQERYEEGEARFIKVTENPLYKSPEIAYTNAGLCMRRAGNSEKAERYLRSALQINPKIPQALFAMSELSYESAQHLTARAYLQRYLEVAPHTPQSLWLGVRVERELGDKNTASSYALLLRSNYPDSRETQLLLESGEL
ncbi:MAG: type IV pilus biogenesis/stability protein PilW [Gammaproteobacteria bacterium]|nr:type IV pilus biogenesis/stability protein PilW [Gammaproteobacteria bacterium]